MLLWIGLRWVTVASVDRLEVKASRGVRLVADKLISECAENSYDLIALPGGMPGAEHLRNCKELQAMLKKQCEEGGLYAAICASPVVVLLHHGLLEDRRATCHPSFADRLENSEAVTSRGPGTALEFALKLVELLFGEEKVEEVAEPMVVT